MKGIKLAFSPCPNDTFIFDAIANERIDLEGLRFDIVMEDVETLNTMAMKGMADMIKVSFHAYLYLSRSYLLLDSGSALGFGNGPLLISRTNIPLEEIPRHTVALPGDMTTAHLLFRIAFPDARLKSFMIFSAIEDAVLNGEADAGVIIHENRFTYQQKGLVKLLDLGFYWENMTGFPVPLGGIVARKTLGYETVLKLNRILRRSVEFAMDHPEQAMEFVRKHAQEMDESVMKKHIGLYVNAFTRDLGEEGKKAIGELMKRIRVAETD